MNMDQVQKKVVAQEVSADAGLISEDSSQVALMRRRYPEDAALIQQFRELPADLQRPMAETVRSLDLIDFLAHEAVGRKPIYSEKLSLDQEDALLDARIAKLQIEDSAHRAVTGKSYDPKAVEDALERVRASARLMAESIVA